MCGINGILLKDAGGRGALGDHIHTMNEGIAHRGPDDDGVWLHDSLPLALGHRRLSILDLSSAGHQPMHTPSGTSIVFNGEIYNFKELREHVPDYPFASGSDTETILALYEKLGEECVSLLNGMFALAIWDPGKQTLFLARDRIGKKPLYYWRGAEGFAWSSEPRSLIQLPWIPSGLDPQALYQYLTFGFTPAPMTMFRSIAKLPPGYKMTIDLQGCGEPQPYWDVSYEEVSGEESGLCEQVREALDKSVKYRMISDVPVGAFLSGGVDSSAIVAHMVQEASYPIKTFSIGFEGQPDYDELEYARKIADTYQTEHHVRMVSRKDMVDLLPKIVEVFDEPLADPTCVPIYFLAELAHQEGLKVILNGDGPDELLMGYRNWMKYVRLFGPYRAYCMLPRPLKQVVANLVAKRSPHSPNTDIFFRAVDRQDLVMAGASGFRDWNKDSFLHPDFVAEAGRQSGHEIVSPFRASFRRATRGSRHWGDADWMCYLGFKYLIPNIYTHRADRLCMAHSVEARSPFLDFHFVQLALSIPVAQKTVQGEPKSILKKALEPTLSHETLYRKKKGFCVPMREWGADVMTNSIEERLPEFCREHGVFNEQAIQGLVAEMRAGRTEYTAALWSIYFLLNWSSTWLKA